MSMKLTNNAKILLFYLICLNGLLTIVDFSFIQSSLTDRPIFIVVTDLIHSFFTYLTEQRDYYT